MTDELAEVLDDLLRAVLLARDLADIPPEIIAEAEKVMKEWGES